MDAYAQFMLVYSIAIALLTTAIVLSLVNRREVRSMSRVTVKKAPKYEPVTVIVELETEEEFKDLFHRLNIAGRRIKNAYFDELKYTRSDVSSVNDELWEALKKIRRDQKLKLKK